MVLPQAVLREATDRKLFDEVVGRERVTRAELATATGFSKPTVSESVRRLTEGGLLAATGPQETGRRGRVGTFYELGTAAGWVLAVEVDQSGVQAWSADLAGRVLHRHDRPPGGAGDTGALAEALRATVSAALRKPPAGPLRAVAVSMANPVHPDTREVIALPRSPFPEGLLSPGDILADLVTAPVLVDNDVNLAALAEQRFGDATSFAYLYVGAGLGLGLYLGGTLVRGAHGLAGEVGYLPGAGWRTLATELAAAGLGRSDAPSNDVAAVLRALDAGTPAVLMALVAAVARAVASVTAVVDPEVVLLGGPLGTHPALLDPVRAAVATLSPSPTRLDHGTLGALAPLHGATHLALDHAVAAAIKHDVPG
ncbi:ROK family transcriptional regulator [Umezawaea tangerina]|uniref:ROK family transcriptional regulator n=1 Tax=Umezawaea tangerina TaxID=84725 RepID=UPI00147540A2|nr:ROK family protein [Umezawaea tangerina]